MKLYTIRDGENIVEFTYERATDKMYLGVKRVRDVVGRCYYLPKKLRAEECSSNVYGYLEQVKSRYKAKIQQLKTELGQVERQFDNEKAMELAAERERARREYDERLRNERPVLHALIDEERERQHQLKAEGN